MPQVATGLTRSRCDARHPQGARGWPQQRRGLGVLAARAERLQKVSGHADSDGASRSLSRLCLPVTTRPRRGPGGDDGARDERGPRTAQVAGRCGSGAQPESVQAACCDRGGWPGQCAGCRRGQLHLAWLSACRVHCSALVAIRHVVGVFGEQFGLVGEQLGYVRRAEHLPRAVGQFRIRSGDLRRFLTPRCDLRVLASQPTAR
jgi:hypothetical protein